MGLVSEVEQQVLEPSDRKTLIIADDVSVKMVETTKYRWSHQRFFEAIFAARRRFVFR